MWTSAADAKPLRVMILVRDDHFMELDTTYGVFSKGLVQKVHVQCLLSTKLGISLCRSLAVSTGTFGDQSSHCFRASPSVDERFTSSALEGPFQERLKVWKPLFFIFPPSSLASADFDFLKRCVQRRAQEKGHGRFGRGGLLHLRVVLSGRHERVQEELQWFACERRRSRIGCPINDRDLSVRAFADSRVPPSNTAPRLPISPGGMAETSFN